MTSDQPTASRFQFHRGTNGQVSVRGDLLVIEFTYSEARVAAMKQIPQARFNRESRSWTVPLRHYDKLATSELFSRSSLHYTFTDESLTDGVARSGAEVEAAVERLRLNPFAVSEGDLNLLDLDIVFRLSPKVPSLRAHLRFRSKAKSVLEKVPRVHYLHSDKSYFFPVEELNLFLKRMRDRKFSFAVEESAGAALSATAAIRARVLNEPLHADGPDLREALLGPFVDLADGDFAETVFSFCSYTTEQLKILFPGKMSYSERRGRAAAFSETELLRLLTRSRSLGEQLWLTKTVFRHLERSKARYEDEVQLSLSSGFDQALLSATELPICWICFEGQAGLLVSRDEFEKCFPASGGPFANQPKELSAAFPDRYFFRVRDSRLPDIREAVSQLIQPSPPESIEFRARVTAVEERRALKLRRDQFQALNDVPPGEFSTELQALIGKLYPHQRVALKWLLETPRAFLGDDMGLGKTLSVLAAFSSLKEQGETDLLLVICPNSLCRTWRRESEHWLPGTQIALLPNEKREKTLFFKKLGWGGALVDGLVLNYEAARLGYVHEALKELLSRRRTFLCLDESQRVKTPSSKTFKAIAELVPYCARRVLLSGTPTPKDIADIWAQMRLLDDGERFGANFYEWLGRVAELGNKYSEFGVKRFYPEQVEEVMLRVQEVLLRRKKEDVLNLPEKTFVVRDVELSGEQLKRYEEVRKDLLLRVSSASGKTFIREIQNILEEYLRAVQIAVNPRLVDENWKGDPAKFQELDLLVEEIVGEREEKLVVWTNFLGNVRELTERYSRYGAAPFSGEVSPAARDTTIRDFQNGAENKMLIAVPAAGGVGITLTAAQTAVYLDKTWNAEHWLQSVDRIHRIGQRGTVQIISLQSCKVDELIARNLERKTAVQAALLGDTEPRERSHDSEGFIGIPSRDELLEALSPKRNG